MRSMDEIIANQEVTSNLANMLDILSLNALSETCSAFREAFSSDSIWKPKCLGLWPELENATGVDSDPFPAWKSCFGRKSKEASNLGDFAGIFRGCDLYTCPNGHIYVIGECRIPIQVARCPECGESIGGRYHRMLQTNNRMGGIMRNFGDSQNGIEDMQAFINSNLDLNTQSGLATIREEEVEETHEEDWNFMQDPPDHLCCPIGMNLLKDPVVTPRGKIYERANIESWLQTHDTDPTDFQALTVQELEPENDVRAAADRYQAAKRQWDEDRNMHQSMFF